MSLRKKVKRLPRRDHKARTVKMLNHLMFNQTSKVLTLHALTLQALNSQTLQSTLGRFVTTKP